MEDDQQFCLRWNNHQSTLIQNFDTLLESGTLVDCTLAAEGKYLKAHKVVLSACSPYFEGLLSEHYDKHPVFILKDVKFKELKAMMDYMYRGEVNISQDQLTALLKAAESLQIKGLSDSRTGGSSTTTTGKTESASRSAKTASSTTSGVSSASVDIPHASSGLSMEKINKVPRQSLQQVSVSDLPDDSASPQLRGISSREGSQSPSRKRKRVRRRSLGNEDTNQSMENHEASNSSDVLSAPSMTAAPTVEDKTHADPAEPIGRSALMQQLTKQPADEMIQIPLEKPEPSEDMIQPKSEYVDDQDSVEELTHFDDDDLNDTEDNSRAGPSHDPSQHSGIAPWHIAGDRSSGSVVTGVGAPGQQDEVFLAAHEAAQAQRDSQALNLRSCLQVKEEFNYCENNQTGLLKLSPGHRDGAQPSFIKVLNVQSISLNEMEQLNRDKIVENPMVAVKQRLVKFPSSTMSSSFRETAPPPRDHHVHLSTSQHPSSKVRDGVSNGYTYSNESHILMSSKALTVNPYVKRKPGRPRIHPINPVIVNKIKRRRGRPYKNGEPQNFHVSGTSTTTSSFVQTSTVNSVSRVSWAEQQQFPVEMDHSIFNGSVLPDMTILSEQQPSANGVSQRSEELVKRKRGRPRVRPLIMDKIKRGPGRPRIHPLKKDKTPKKRGRPPKNKEIDQNFDIPVNPTPILTSKNFDDCLSPSSLDNFTTSSYFELTASSEPSKRKRGRPKKNEDGQNFNISEIQMSVESDDQSGPLASSSATSKDLNSCEPDISQ